jgi:glycosyltransferase involved in cell wall biosynthesis
VGFRLVAVSRWLSTELETRFGFGPGTVASIPNGTELPLDAVPRRHVPGEPLRVLAVGNLYPVKNHGLLIHVAAGLRARGIGVEVDILGRGQEEGPLRGLIAELRLEDSVRLHGFRSDVPAFLRRAHVFASTSRFEAMPLSFLEAMGHAVPVVASRVGGVAEIVEDRRTGLLFDDGDVEAACAALSTLAADESLRLDYAAAAARRVRERFGVDVMLRRYLDLYSELAAEARS